MSVQAYSLTFKLYFRFHFGFLALRPPWDIAMFVLAPTPHGLNPAHPE